MVMLPPVEPDEDLVAHGVYVQRRQGQQTPIQEFWTAHSLPDGAMIWRSQMLYQGEIPISACYLLRDPDSRPVQMVFYWRWSEDREDVIEYHFMPGHMTIFHQRQAQEMILPAAYEVYGWHTVTEHFLWHSYGNRQREPQTFQLVAPGIQHESLWPSIFTLEAKLVQQAIIPGQTGPRAGYTYAIQMPDMGPQQLQLDESGVPLHWALPDQEMAVDLAEYTRLGW